LSSLKQEVKEIIEEREYSFLTREKTMLDEKESHFTIRFKTIWEYASP
jgi:hypothetical protein